MKTPSRPLPQRAARSPAVPRARASAASLAAALLATLALGLAAPARAQHSGVSGCPGSASLAALGGGFGVPSAAAPLKPGGTLPTLGTTLAGSPELAGEWLLTESRPFDFMTPSGRVLGEIVSKVIDADNCSCDLYWQVSVSPKSTGRIAALTLRGYRYKTEEPLYADFRVDQRGQIGPDQVTRSAGIGSTVRFVFKGGLGAGQSSKPMFLNTAIANVVGNGSLQVQGVGGGASSWLPTQMPTSAP